MIPTAKDIFDINESSFNAIYELVVVKYDGRVFEDRMRKMVVVVIL